MLNRIKRVTKFWNDRVYRFKFCVKHVKINIMKPENYNDCWHISIPTGNSERLWGFKTQGEAQKFVECYRGIVLAKSKDRPVDEIEERYVYVEESNKWSADRG